jgi:energy-coupling factor transporter ATP-binding protein EcfA2
MDFYKITSQQMKNGDWEIHPDFIVARSNDLMIRGRSFYAIWDEEAGLWSTDEYSVQRLVDEDMRKEQEAIEKQGKQYHIRAMRNFDTRTWVKYRTFLSNLGDNYVPLDTKLTFADSEPKKTDYASRKLPYSLAPGDHSAWDKLVGTLYSETERAKIEWAIGAVVSGDSKNIQKFLVLYGPAGSGKSTILNIIGKLFEGYVAYFDAKSLGQSSNAFALEAFRDNPLVAIQHDGDLSKIDDNSKLNSIISHEEMVFNEKFKSTYTGQVYAFLFMGTNQPVRITDAKSGIIRRLIDVMPSGNKIPVKQYQSLVMRTNFELGAIAHHCLQVYQKMGPNYYDGYKPIEMMYQTDVFFNFIEAHLDIFASKEYFALREIYDMYKDYCLDSGITKPLPMYKLRADLMDYFETFEQSRRVDNSLKRSVYSGFQVDKFKYPVMKEEAPISLQVLDQHSILDDILAEFPAQLSTESGIPKQRWATVETALKDIDTHLTHFVKIPENMIVIDFDLREDGKKSLKKNLEAASTWPPTYSEISNSGHGLHLHYYYEGDPKELASEYAPGIEIKAYFGNSALRRKVTFCNNTSIATLKNGLPRKEKRLPTMQQIKSERALRELIERNLRKEIHPGTKPSIDFIAKILEDASATDLVYDVSDMEPAILAFAGASTNHALEALKVVQHMKFKSLTESYEEHFQDERLVFFDVEVFPNLFVVCWKYQGDPNVTRMINPSSHDVEKLFNLRLVGFNNRRYDNHILYGRALGFTNEALYNLSQSIINENRSKGSTTFGAAYGISYTDVYDFSSKKQGLKKFEIELGINHIELDMPWDQPVPPEKWSLVEQYCVNDVLATERVFVERYQDFVARKILCELSGLTPNHTTQQHTAKIIFGNERNPQRQFKYTRLSEMFPGYKFEAGVSTYRDEKVGEGGYVYAEPGYYENVALLDVASMHPTSIEKLNFFGPFTKNFADLTKARLAIKHKDYDSAIKMLDGKLKPYLTDAEQADALAYALKIVINIVYGLTSAHFENPFFDPRNKDNIVAKRGALFMIDLKHAVQERGFTVAHIKTDSIKIPNATPEIIEFVKEFGAKYGYTFEHEATYEKFCLVNDAVYVARKGGVWSATGAQFAHPYVFKTLFSHDDYVFEDYCEIKQVTKGAIYLEVDGQMRFIGRAGNFIPLLNCGGTLYRVHEGKNYSVTGTKGHFWLEAESAKWLGEDFELDQPYFDKLVTSAKKALEQFCPFETLMEG